MEALPHTGGGSLFCLTQSYTPMMPRLLIVLCLALIATGCGRSSADQESDAPNAEANADAAHNALTDAERADGWHLLFDGETTNGWRNFNATDVSSEWQVEDGTLTLTEQGGGDLITDEMFENFELAIDWRISEAGNSGIFFNVTEGEDYDAVFETGPEYQLLDDESAADNQDPTHRAGSNYDLHAPSEEAVRPAGEWNTTRIVVDEGRVQHYLNDVMVVEYELWTDAWREDVANSKFADMEGYGQARSGHIALQDHGDRIWFRNIKVRPLVDDSATADTGGG